MISARTEKPISTRYLSEDERVAIADLHRAKLGVRQIARELGRDPSTISRELQRNRDSRGQYRPFTAHRMAAERRARHLEVAAPAREVGPRYHVLGYKTVSVKIFDGRRG